MYVEKAAFSFFNSLKLLQKSDDFCKSFKPGAQVSCYFMRYA